MADAVLNSNGNTIQSILLFGLAAKLWIMLYHTNDADKPPPSPSRRQRRHLVERPRAVTDSVEARTRRQKLCNVHKPQRYKHQHHYQRQRHHSHHHQQHHERSQTFPLLDPSSYQQRRRARLSYDENDNFGVLYEEDRQNLDDCEEDEVSSDQSEDDEEEKETNNFSRNRSMGARDRGDAEHHQTMQKFAKRKSSSGSRKHTELEEFELERQWEILEKERGKLMEKISMADSVLSRQTSVDFHPKNSNWSHFEGYTPSFARPDSSPKLDPTAKSDQNATKNDDRIDPKSLNFDATPPLSAPEKNDLNADISGEDEDEDGEEFLWAEPPSNGLRDTIKNTIERFVSAGRESFNQSSSSTKENISEALSLLEESLDTQQKPIPTANANEYSAPFFSRRDSGDIVRTFNAGIMPSKLIMIRHGQSEGNVDELLYATIPDNAMRLTKLGFDMARMAGKALREQLPPGETVHFVVSPYARTVETFHGLVSAWCDPEEFNHISSRNKRLKAWYSKLMEMGLTWHEDPRIREQDFGNYQDPNVIKRCKSERHKFGSFYYRMPHGESASDVFDRVSTFLDSLWRSFESQRAQNYVLVTHGIAIRVFLARYFRYSIDQFNMLANPRNCEMVILAHDGNGRLKLDGRCDLELSKVGNNDVNGETKEENGSTETVVVGYKLHKRLRTLPPQYIQARTIRMCYNDTGS